MLFVSLEPASLDPEYLRIWTKAKPLIIAIDAPKSCLPVVFQAFFTSFLPILCNGMIKKETRINIVPGSQAHFKV